MEHRNEQPHALSFLPRAGNREIRVRVPRATPHERNEKEDAKP